MLYNQKNVGKYFIEGTGHILYLHNVQSRTIKKVFKGIKH